MGSNPTLSAEPIRNRPASIEHRWDVLYRDFPEIYDEFSSFPYDPRPVDVVAREFPVNGKTVIDLGAGTGRSTLELARQAHFVVGVERERAMLEVGVRRAATPSVRNLAFAIGDAAALPLRDAAADLVVAFTAPVRTSEAFRVLRPGGHVVRVDIPPGRYGGDLNQVIAHPTPGLDADERILLAAGFKYFDFESTQNYGSTENMIRTFGFIFGSTVIDHLRRTRRSSVVWTFRVYDLRKPD